MLHVKNIIADYGPKQIEAGEPFNRHNDQNTFWVKLTSKLGNPSIIINDLDEMPIIPAYDKLNDMLSFQVVQGLTTKIRKSTSFSSRYQ